MNPLTSTPDVGEPIPNMGALIEKLNMTFEVLTAKLTIVTMPVHGNTQPYGILHGGATAALCETAASAAATVHAEAVTKAHAGVNLIAVGSQMSISHVYPGRAGLVKATAKAVHLGRSTTVHNVTVTGEDGRTISVALVTNALISRRPDRDSNG